jgi:hypothetical protein
LFQTTQLIAQNSVQLKDVGSATSSVMFVRSIGGSIGVSMLGALYAHRITDSLKDSLGGATPLGGGTQLSPAVVRTLPANVNQALQKAIVHGITMVFLVSAIIAIVGVLCAVFIKHVPLRGISPAAKPAEGTAPPAPASGGAVAAPAVVAQPVAAPMNGQSAMPLPVTALAVAAQAAQQGGTPATVIATAPSVAAPAAVPAPASAPAAVQPVAIPVAVPRATAEPIPALTVESVSGPGLLVCAMNGAPVPGATVTLLGKNGREIEVGRCDGTGAYRPSPAAAQAFAVIASAPGYAPHAGLVAEPNGVAQRVVLKPLPAQQASMVPVS